MIMQSVEPVDPRARGKKKEAIAPPPNFKNDRRFQLLMPFLSGSFTGLP
jgi:hypothetical protein